MEDRDLKPIKNILFGYSDGKNEARDSHFESLFYDGDRYYDKLSNRRLSYLIIGRKGTGKTLLVRYFMKQVLKNKDIHCKLITGGDFTVEKLEQLDYTKIKEEEREIFWRYVIIKEFVSLVLKNEKSRLTRKLTRMDKSLELNLTSLIKKESFSSDAKIAISPNIGTKIKETGTSEYVPASYFKDIKPLASELIDVLKKSKGRYFLIFDDLDEIKLNSMETYKKEDKTRILAELLNDFVRAISYINDELFELDKDNRVISTLRKDLVGQMQSYANNLNKVTSDNGIDIMWLSPMDKNMPEKSSLGKLVLHKVKASISEYHDMDDKNLFQAIFKRNSSNAENPFRYIVNRGFGRPRDVVQYLTIVKKRFPDANKITRHMVQDVQGEYCSWFFSELQNEINILENRDSIMATIEAIKKHGSIVFTYEQLCLFLKKRESEFSNIKNLKEDLKSLFILGALGNKEEKSTKQKPTIEYSYRDGIPNPDFSKNFLVHPALRNYLSL